MKKNILFMFIGMIIATIVCVGVYALNASDITYNNTTVEGALNDLYTTTTNTISELENQISTLQSQVNSFSTFSELITLKSSKGYLQFNQLKNGYSTFKVRNSWKATTSSCDISKILNITSSEEEDSQYSFDTVYTIPDNSNRLILNAQNGQCDFMVYLYK